MKPYALVVAAVVMLSAIACQGKSDATTSDPGASSTKPVTLHLAYFPNVTHAHPIVALARGTFADKLGANVKLETKTFNAGPAEIEALFSGDIDIGYIGPNPTVNGYVKSRGEDVRVIAGAVSGGAQLIVRDGAAINEPADFANTGPDDHARTRNVSLAFGTGTRPRRQTAGGVAVAQGVHRQAQRLLGQRS